ncbi:hypothetical protein D1222_10605 [Henriciella algicola]|uniref:TonB C-terminal domain-containing protein n=1 Tax=Henriciella algicola TaxID=1608422 RepID=A0A399RE91_9PROT|nr:hypothetical protein D1222_10605 [Henriciella algicola]
MRARGLRVVVSAAFACIATSVAVAQDRDAQPLTSPQPSYPFLASLFNVQGACEVRFSVDEEGLPFGLTTQCTQPIFCHEAERAVSRVRFLPKLVDGIPTVRRNVIYPLEFRFWQYDPETDTWSDPIDYDDHDAAEVNYGPVAPCKEIPVS